MDDTIFDVPNLIKSNKYFQVISHIKNYEDTLQKLFLSSKDSELIKNPTIFTWKIQQNNDLFPNIKELNLDIFGLQKNDLLDNIVLTGPYIRSYFMSIDENDKIRNEIYAYKIGNDKWENIIDITDFENKKSEFVLQTKNTSIYLIKKKYKSLSHIMLQHTYLKRCGWWNGDFYTSSMFLIDIQKHTQLLCNKFRDPILNVPYDPLDVFIKFSQIQINPIIIINMIDHNNLLKMSPKDLTKIYENKTCLELCLDKYIIEKNPIFINELKKMIVYLTFLTYKRPPFLYAKILELDKHVPDLYKLIKNVPCEYGIIENTNNLYGKTLDDINNVIIDKLIMADLSNSLNDYLIYINQKISKNIIDLLIKYKATKIIKYLISQKLIDQNFIYYLILMTENIELIKELDIKFNFEIALNYISDILENGKARSFYFLYELDQNILNMKFDNNENILHKIKPFGNFSDLIKIIMKLKPDLINCIDSQKITPLIYYAKKYPILLQYFIDYDFDETLCDNEGNTFLHYICKHECVDILSIFIKRCPELINMPNKNAETPIIIACINGNEDMFYILKGFGADIDSQDSYGNTVYHYICANSICLGLTIKNKLNYFNLTPKDYCKISSNFYNFIEENNE